MGIKKVAGHHVATEQQIMFGTIEAAVTNCVTGEMNHFQPAPKRQVLAVCEEFVNFDRPITEGFASKGFHPPAPPTNALIGIGAVNMGLFAWMRVNLCAAPFFKTGDIPGVVQMAVREQNGLE